MDEPTPQQQDAAAEPAVSVRQVTKIFRDFWHRPKVRAVNGIDLEIPYGEVFGLLGPNGSGKTTTLKLLLGLLYPSAGRIRILGRAASHVRTKARIGYLPEESYLYRYLTCEETLEFYGKLFALGRATRRDRIDQLLEMIGLRHARHRLVGEFSKGMLRRIGLAQALINDPDLVLLDEPTAGLDPIGCRQIKDLIRTLAGRGKTVVICSHLLADIEDICDRIAILFNGRIRAEGRVDDLLQAKDRCKLGLPQLSGEMLSRVLAAVRRELGEDATVEYPRRDLEQFFLEVVRDAQKTDTEHSGVRQTETLPAYLADPDGVKEDVLAKLTVPRATHRPAGRAEADAKDGPE